MPPKDRASPFSRKHKRYWLPVTGGMVLIGVINLGIGIYLYSRRPRDAPRGDALDEIAARLATPHTDAERTFEIVWQLRHDGLARYTGDLGAARDALVTVGATGAVAIVDQARAHPEERGALDRALAATDDDLRERLVTYAREQGLFTAN